MDEMTVALHFSNNGPVAAVYEFFDAVYDSDFRRCWMMWVDDLKRDAARHWVDTNLEVLRQWQKRGRDEMVAAIAAVVDPLTLSGKDRDLWTSFQQTQLLAMRSKWSHFIGLQAAGRLGAASATRIIGPNLERVLLAEPTSPEVRAANEPVAIRALPIDVYWDGARWSIASITEPPR